MIQPSPDKQMNDFGKHITQFNNTAPQVDYEPRIEQRGGRTYTVVPVVMMVEGVHSGSAGPILHLPENFSQNVSQWNGVPATVGHPQENGEYVLASEADPDQWIVGFVDNAHMEDNKLKAEVWIDQQRALATNPEVLNYITEGKPLDVSTGLISRDLQKQGQHNGEQYEAITVEYQADHLALLPGDMGACSWADGCGIRTNKHKEATNEMSKLTEHLQALKTGIRSAAVGVSNFAEDTLQVLEMGFIELSSTVQRQLDRLDSEAKMHFLKEMYNDHFVYEVRDRDAGTARYYKQEYDVENNEVAFTGDPTEVRRDVNYVPVQANTAVGEDCGCGGKMKRTKFNTNQNDTEETMSQNKQELPTADVMDKVSSLVNNERTRFTKDDRDWLLKLNEAQLTKLEPTEAPEPEVTREQALQALEADLSNAEKLKGILPESTRKQFETGMTAYNDKREKLVKSIQANTEEGTWPEDELKDMSINMLERIAKSVQPTDYSGLGAGGHITNNGAAEEGEVLLPNGVEIES